MHRAQNKGPCFAYVFLLGPKWNSLWFPQFPFQGREILLVSLMDGSSSQDPSIL